VSVLLLNLASITNAHVSVSKTEQRLGKTHGASSGRSNLLVGLALLLIFGLGLAVRLYDLTDPPLDFHPTRQLRMAMITRGIYYKMSSQPDPVLRETAIAYGRSMGLYEPPILENMVAFTYQFLGGEYLWISRLFTSVFWLVGGIALFGLTRRMTSNGGALISTTFYLFLPFSVIASRSFQPDPGMVMWVILATYAFYRWAQEKQWRWAVLAGGLSGVAVLVKAVAGYLVVGLAIAVVIYALGLKRSFKNPQVWTMAGLMAFPGTLYYVFILQGRSSDYFMNWTVALLPMLLSPSFYVQWLVHLQDLIGLTVLLLSLVGVLISRPLNRSVLLGLWAGYGIYGLSLPYQITTHSYYSLQLVPIVAISLAPVATLLLEHISVQGMLSPALWRWQVSFWVLMAIFLAFSIWNSVYTLDSQDYRVAPSLWSGIAGSIPEEGKIIALTQDYGYPLMYYGWKKVKLWPDTAERNLANLRGKGGDNLQKEFNERIQSKSYFLVTDFDQFDRQPVLKGLLYEEYPIYAQGSGYLVFDLQHPLSASQ
jgi:hypothetical protein